MLEWIRRQLVPTDGLERHLLTAKLLGRPVTVVDVGGIRGHLAEFLPQATVTAVNVDRNADVVIAPGPHPLPLGDRAFEASASLDTLEHIPSPDRPFFVDETLRVADRLTVLCCPLGTPARYEVEEADNAWYRALTGSDHPWISEHLEHGVPSHRDLEELFAMETHEVSYRFSGDVRATSRQFRMAELSNVTRRPVDIARWVAFRGRHRPDLELQATASPFTNRVFVVATRRA
jgi:hypothetical protein